MIADDNASSAGWIAVRIPGEVGPLALAAIQQMLAESKSIEAHHGHGTPVMRWMNANGDMEGYGFYIRPVAVKA